MQCTLFAYGATFGATIETNNIQEIQSAGLCFNTTGGPTVDDITVSETNTGTGWWAESPPTFEMSLADLPLDTSLFLRPYVTTIANEVVYLYYNQFLLLSCRHIYQKLASYPSFFS